jgi:HAD superfamily hydrolase (TIGR01490 family)
MTLAIFDLDNTLLGGDSDHAWGEFIADLGIVDGKSYREKNDAFYGDYCRGELDIFAYQRFVLQPLTGFNMAELARWHEQFMREKIEPIILPKAQALVDSHRAQGHTLMIITATNSFITAPIAKTLWYRHVNRYHAGRKKRRVHRRYCRRAVLSRRESETPACVAGRKQCKACMGSYFYSDSHNDLPLLQLVDHACCC